MMRRAIPAIAVSAAGLTWLLHAQGVIDGQPSTTRGVDEGASSRSASPLPGASTTAPANAPSTLAPTTTTRRRSRDDDGPVSRLPPSTATTTPPSTSPAPAGDTRTVDGPVVDTKFGPVQVEVVLAGDRIVDVKALAYPSDARRSQSINRQALPLLHDEVVEAQSANLDGVSGATYTADAYERSLQGALDKAQGR